MILIDTNLLLFARDSEAPRHTAARSWLEDRLNGTAPVGLAWPVLTAFVRIATHPRVYERPLGADEAWAQVEEWLAAEPSWIVVPTPRHGEVLGGLLRDHGVHGNLVPDADLAALAIEHGLTICSADTDFARFPEVRWENPLD